MAFKELPLGEVSLNPFTKLDKEWGLVAAGNADASNAMTVSWGGMVSSSGHKNTRQPVSAAMVFTPPTWSK